MSAPFSHVVFTPTGAGKAGRITTAFEDLLSVLEKECTGSAGGRELALAKTNLQQACFWAKRAVAESSENRQD